MKKILSVLILILNISLFSQQINTHQKLIQEAEENHKLLRTDPEIAFKNAKEIEKESFRLKANYAELRALDTQCNYYKINDDFDNMLKIGRKLLEKAEKYKFVAFQAIANKNLFEALIFSGLSDEAYSKLQASVKLADKLEDDEEFNLLIKSDVYIAMSNYYYLKKDYENQFKFIKLSGDFIKKIPTKPIRERLMYIHNSNLAGVNMQLQKLDSSKYFAELSLSQENNFKRVDIQFNNFLILGSIAIDEKNSSEALSNLQKAEKLIGYKNYLNAEELYNKLIIVHTDLRDIEKANHYRTKLDSLKLTITENQNKSLHTLLNENKNNKKNNSYYLLIFIGLVIISFFSFRIWRKERILSQLEKSNQEYLEINKMKQKQEEYLNLFKLLEKNDPFFMKYFKEYFIDFNHNLLKSNPNLSQSEIEICALIKLNLSTKDIAKYKFLAPKTVQNKKYIIRKKLNIPSEVDIYEWIENL